MLFCDIQIQENLLGPVSTVSAVLVEEHDEMKQIAAWYLLDELESFAKSKRNKPANILARELQPFDDFPMSDMTIQDLFDWVGGRVTLDASSKGSLAAIWDAAYRSVDVPLEEAVPDLAPLRSEYAKAAYEKARKGSGSYRKYYLNAGRFLEQIARRPVGLTSKQESWLRILKKDLQREAIAVGYDSPMWID